jgi:hypothetical protein
VLRLLLHAAHDALFATYVFPHECSVRAPRRARARGRLRLTACRFAW